MLRPERTETDIVHQTLYKVHKTGFLLELWSWISKHHVEEKASIGDKGIRENQVFARVVVGLEDMDQIRLSYAPRAL